MYRKQLVPRKYETPVYLFIYSLTSYLRQAVQVKENTDFYLDNFQLYIMAAFIIDWV